MTHHTDLLPDDESLPPRHPVPGVRFCGLLETLGATLWYRLDASALTNSPVSWDPQERFPCVVELDLHLPARDGGSTWVAVTFAHPSMSRPGSPEFAHAVRQVLHRAMTHEADEALLVDGVRVFDPHQHEARG